MNKLNNKQETITYSLDKEYLRFLSELKEKIKSAQLRTALAVNSGVISLYWHIGKQIIEKQEKEKWGSKFIEILSHDLQNSFPETHGFSKRNLERMRQFAQTYTVLEFAAQAVPQLP
jgi:predicted nuclease of restriction endonuclease-like (RecB) superfamily